MADNARDPKWQDMSHLHRRNKVQEFINSENVDVDEFIYGIMCLPSGNYHNSPIFNSFCKVNIFPAKSGDSDAKVKEKIKSMKQDQNRFSRNLYPTKL